MTKEFSKTDRIMAALAPACVRVGEFVAMPEAERLAAIKAASVPTADCGPVTVAPARGFTLVTNPIGMIPDGADGWKPERVAYRGRSVLKRGDVFDVMNAAAVAGGRACPFDEGQMWVARRYRALVEGRMAGGVKCSSAGGGGGGEGARDFMDHFIADGEALAHLLARIGDGASMVVRRVRPSARNGGVKAGMILDRVLVDMICLDDKTPGQVLDRHGWGNDGQYRKMVRAALAGVLDRMQGVR